MAKENIVILGAGYGGSEPEYFNIKGVKENSVSLRSLYSTMDVHRRIKNLLHRASQEKDHKARQSASKPIFAICG
ncbi:hypothetical protein [Desulfotomaculum nigrificans]|uniref:hypothetical protein n=1 Tax=Desulfotomaculum nigrificans TaxID=1565 RepID=UPI0001FADFCD|nr:hypothetical protein [Desulfotomaculum nigrificans]